MSQPEEFQAIQWTGRNIAECKAFDARIDLGDGENTVAIDCEPESVNLPPGCWISARGR